MNNRPLSGKLIPILIALYAFCLPIYQQVSVICIVLLLLLQLFFSGLKTGFKIIHINKILWLPLAFYLIHVLGLWNTSNWDYAWMDLQIKASFMIFPLFLSPILFDRRMMRNAIFGFISGCLLASLYCFLSSTMQFYNSGDYTSFFYIPYSRFLHVTYFSMYLNLSVLLLFFESFYKKQDSIWVKKAGNTGVFICIAFLFLNIMLLSARMALITGYFTSILFCLLSLRQIKSNPGIKRALIALSIFILVCQPLVLHFSNRFTQVQEVMSAPGKTGSALSDITHQEPANSTSIRLHTWQAAWDIWKDNFWTGVGTGDIKEELYQRYLATGFEYGIKDRTSPHNQILHTAVIGGVIGVIVLILFFMVPLYNSIQNRNPVLLCFLILLGLNTLTEGIFEVQKGVIFICFFYIFLQQEQFQTVVGRVSGKNH